MPTHSQNSRQIVIFVLLTAIGAKYLAFDCDHYMESFAILYNVSKRFLTVNFFRSKYWQTFYSNQIYATLFFLPKSQSYFCENRMAS